jgi:hypothetical protein
MPNMMEMTGGEMAALMETMAVAMQNDQFRKAMVEGATLLTPRGRYLLTRAVADRGAEFERAAIRAVAEDTAFTEDNDPHGERSFGTVEVQGVKLLWKIDLYDTAYEWASPDPAAKNLTRRVLTIMLPSDY